MFVNTITSVQINLLYPAKLLLRISIRANVGKSKIDKKNSNSKIPIDKKSVVI